MMLPQCVIKHLPIRLTEGGSNITPHIRSSDECVTKFIEMHVGITFLALDFEELPVLIHWRFL